MQKYFEPTQESGRAFFMRGIMGSVVMLNPLAAATGTHCLTKPELRRNLQ
jgi:hypothetical protein